MTYLHIDVVLTTLIGPENPTIERFISAAERGEQELAILELALYCAICSLRSDDRLNLLRFTRLLRFSKIVPSPKPFDPPTEDEIAHWRDVALGLNDDAD